MLVSPKITLALHRCTSLTGTVRTTTGTTDLIVNAKVLITVVVMPLQLLLSFDVTTTVRYRHHHEYSCHLLCYNCL